jgi:hypothetical protein
LPGLSTSLRNVRTALRSYIRCSQKDEETENHETLTVVPDKVQTMQVPLTMENCLEGPFKGIFYFGIQFSALIMSTLYHFFLRHSKVNLNASPTYHAESQKCNNNNNICFDADIHLSILIKQISNNERADLIYTSMYE